MFKTLHKRPNNKSIGSKLTGRLKLILSSSILAICLSLHSFRRAIQGISSQPISVRQYSTFGGTS